MTNHTEGPQRPSPADYREVRRLTQELDDLFTDYCNGVIDESGYDEGFETITSALEANPAYQEAKRS